MASRICFVKILNINYSREPPVRLRMPFRPEAPGKMPVYGKEESPCRYGQADAGSSPYLSLIHI